MSPTILAGSIFGLPTPSLVWQWVIIGTIAAGFLAVNYAALDEVDGDVIADEPPASRIVRMFASFEVLDWCIFVNLVMALDTLIGRTLGVPELTPTPVMTPTAWAIDWLVGGDATPWLLNQHADHYEPVSPTWLFRRLSTALIDSATAA